nr:hypothetical protein Iba_chr09eCG12220 [Ipomoea batatas]
MSTAATLFAGKKMGATLAAAAGTEMSRGGGSAANGRGRRSCCRPSSPSSIIAAATSRRKVEAGEGNAEAVDRRRCCCEQGIPSRSVDPTGACWSASRAREERGKKGTPRAAYAVRAPLLRRGKPASPATLCFAGEKRMTIVGGACLPIA